MQGFNLLDDGDDGTVFRDIILLALLGFVTIVVLLLPHLNPPTQVTESTPQPGNIVVELHWPNEMNTDVDLWVQAPGDVPVGYSNKGGAVFNLLRDDLGHINDTSELNYEIAFSRGAPAGEYTVNLHLYSNSSVRTIVPAEVVIGVKSDNDAPLKIIAKEHVELFHIGQELTVVRFSLDSQANLIPNSVHNLPKALRSAFIKQRG